jgi:hypothetical protein
MIVLARYVVPRQSFSVAKIHQVQTTRAVYETGLAVLRTRPASWRYRFMLANSFFNVSGTMLQHGREDNILLNQ